MPEGYAPYPLVSDASSFGLVETTVTGELGTTVARHLPARGSRRATLFLHGAAGSWTTWTPVLEAARAEGTSIPDPVLFDLPGWGDGILVERDGTRSIDTVCALVRDAAIGLGYTQWDLVGHSMGGFIAMHMASIWPQSVRSVVMVSGTTWSVIESVEHPVRNFRALPAFTMLWQVMRLLDVFGRAGRALVRGMGRIGLLRPAVFPLFRHPFRVPRSVIGSLSREVRPHSFATAAEIPRGYDADAAWASISCPVTALKGDRDAFVRDSDLERLARILPAARTAIIDDCGHFGNIERPRVVRDAIASARTR